jgi:hypothetical protein
MEHSLVAGAEGANGGKELGGVVGKQDAGLQGRQDVACQAETRTSGDA